MGDHAVLQTMVWLEEQEVPNRTKYLQPMEMIRVFCTGPEEKNLFCGILCSSRAKLVQGRAAVDLQVYSSSCKLDLKRKNRSFQDEQRSRGNLFSLLLKEYQGDFIWDQPGRVQSGNFLCSTRRQTGSSWKESLHKRDIFCRRKYIFRVSVYVWVSRNTRSGRRFQTEIVV